MNSLDWTWNSLFILLGFILIISELFIGVSTGFDLVLIGLTFIVGGGIGTLFHSQIIGILTIIVLSFSYMLFGRNVVKQKLGIATKATNIDAVIGRGGIVVKTIKPGQAGQVKIGVEIWRAVSDESLKTGQKIEVVSIEGSSVNVIKHS